MSRARSGLPIHKSLAHVSAMGTVQLSFTTDSLLLGHNEIAVLVNADGPGLTGNEVNFANNFVLKEICLDSPANIEIVHDSVVHKQNSSTSQLTVRVRNKGSVNYAKGALFGIIADSADRNDYNYRVISEPVYQDVAAHSVEVINGWFLFVSLCLHSLSLLLAVVWVS